MTCKLCGGALHPTATTGYCHRNPECKRASRNVRNNRYREGNPHFYVYLDSADQIIYIGESTSRRRDQQHLKDDEWALDIYKKKTAPAPEDTALRRRMEIELIHKYHPIHNKRCRACPGDGSNTPHKEIPTEEITYEDLLNDDKEEDQ